MFNYVNRWMTTIIFSCVTLLFALFALFMAWQNSFLAMTILATATAAGVVFSCRSVLEVTAEENRKLVNTMADSWNSKENTLTTCLRAVLHQLQPSKEARIGLILRHLFEMRNHSPETDRMLYQQVVSGFHVPEEGQKALAIIKNLQLETEVKKLHHLNNCSDNGELPDLETIGHFNAKQKRLREIEVTVRNVHGWANDPGH